MRLQQGFVQVEVRYYDDEQKEKLLFYPSAKKQKEIVDGTIKIPTEEFLTYYLFHKKRPGKVGFRSYSELGSKIGVALADLEGFIQFNGDSISVPEDVGYQDNAIAEHIGESIGLSVINRIHGLTEADWDKIPEIRGSKGEKTFDYQVASDGKNTIEVETKGSCPYDSAVKTSSIRSHKRSILEKKTAIKGVTYQRLPVEMITFYMGQFR